jgi:hypothetical protein
MLNDNNKGWAVTILSIEDTDDKKPVERIVIAIFAHEHNARFYVEKTYKNQKYLKPEIIPVVWMAIRDR